MLACAFIPRQPAGEKGLFKKNEIKYLIFNILPLQFLKAIDFPN